MLHQVNAKAPWAVSLARLSRVRAFLVRRKCDANGAKADIRISSMRRGLESFKGAWTRAFGKPATNLALRVVVMFAGLISIGAGIALAKYASLGTSPISSMAAVYTEVGEQMGLPLTMGMWTFVFNALFFLLEIALLRKRFNPIQFLQIPLFIVLSVSVDAWLWIFGALPLDSYIQQLIYVLASVLLLAFGIRVQLASDLLMTPGDAAVQVISYVSKKRFSSCKMAWDVSLVCLAVISSLAFLGGIYQVREGTIIGALLVGPMVRVFGKLLGPLAWLVPEARTGIVPPLCPEEKPIEALATAES